MANLLEPYTVGDRWCLNFGPGCLVRKTENAEIMSLVIVIGVVVGILVILLGIVALLFYRGYGKIRGKALDGK